MTSPTKPKIICFRPGNDDPVASYWDLIPQNMRSEKISIFWGHRPMRIQYKLLIRLHDPTI
jgi:hypothetical protein